MNGYILLVVVALIAVVSATAPLTMADSKGIDRQFIVVFQNDAADAEKEAHIAHLQVENVVKFNIGDFSGYSASLSAELLAQVRESKIVKYVEQDRIMTAWQACVQQKNAEWNLDRIAERELDLDGLYNYESVAGAGVVSYVVDTGILITHTQFQGRATWGANFIDSVNTDCNGHGTHVAGTVGGVTYGVAKKTTLVAVKVLDCNGSGSNTAVISGVNFTVTDSKKRGAIAVANMSLGGGLSTALTDAVNAAVAQGVFFAVAAGNDDQNACNYSPANAASAVCVGATDIGASGVNQLDVRSYFSNWGTCVDIFAPGSDITSAWIGSNTAINTISGTSMATPHVCGVAAILRAENPSASPATINGMLNSYATNGVITLSCDGTTKTACDKSPNRLLYSACDA